jgi:phosphoesterase RecJ-like protein
LLGLGWALRTLGKEPILACQDPLPGRFDYLPGFADVVHGPVQQPFDLLVALDCSDGERLGTIIELERLPTTPILNIDHHVTNLQFGTVNLVDAEAVSTTQILYRLIQHLGIPLDDRIAVCILTGIVTDTRGFRTANVTPEVLTIATEMMEAGASLTTVTRNGLDRRPLAALRLWGAGLARMEIADGVVWTTLPLDVQRAAGAHGASATGLSSTLVSAEEANVSAVFTERPDGKVEVGFRAVPGYDVAEVALALGGGGHPLASGCLIPGPFEEAKQRVLSLLVRSIAEQRQRMAEDVRRHPEPG